MNQLILNKFKLFFKNEEFYNIIFTNDYTYKKDLLKIFKYIELTEFSGQIIKFELLLEQQENIFLENYPQINEKFLFIKNFVKSNDKELLFDKIFKDKRINELYDRERKSFSNRNDFEIKIQALINKRYENHSANSVFILNQKPFDAINLIIHEIK